MSDDDIVVQSRKVILETCTRRAEISLWMQETGEVRAEVCVPLGGVEFLIGYGEEKPREPRTFKPGDEFSVRYGVDAWILVKVPAENRIFFVDTSYNTVCYAFEVKNPYEVTQAELDKRFGKGFLKLIARGSGQ